MDDAIASGSLKISGRLFQPGGPALRRRRPSLRRVSEMMLPSLRLGLRTRRSALQRDMLVSSAYERITCPGPNQLNLTFPCLARLDRPFAKLIQNFAKI